jgi:hypothetical protein
MNLSGIEPQNTEQGIMNVEVWKSEKHFLILHSLFDIQRGDQPSFAHEIESIAI